ncbi:DNA repair protein recN [Phycicoccus elongatus Lp2]|uniref:DNA repair protein RecN n=2 Tax=Phycicoccus elongatus TaxID=101689 RepID=N0DXZ5_9MICO|nr:DNA repair protein recN [Phycicoccus elongatus Lp2]
MAWYWAPILMLSDIAITDLGVIDHARLDLDRGLTVLTGETGAGKTMVVTGLGLLLGSRADSALVREGSSRAVVEGVASLPDGHQARTVATEAGAPDEADLVLVRTVSAEGRSRAHVGGRMAPIGVLAEIGEHLVAVHGQADQWRLRHLDQHRDLLDRFGGPELEHAFTAYRMAYEDHANAQQELTELRAHARERAQEAAALTVGLERIDGADPQPGEDHALAVEAERLGHVEDLRAAASEATLLLSGADEASGVDDAGVLGRMARARSALQQAGDMDPALAELGSRAAELGHLLTDLAADVASYAAGLDVEDGRLDAVNERRALLSELTRIYGADIDEVIAWGRSAAARLGGLLDDDGRVDQLDAAVADLAAAREVAAQDLTRQRQRAAAELSAGITAELAQLAMPHTVVAVEVRPAARPGPSGADDVEIGLRSHAGGVLRSIARSASGGELSRIMLAIEVAIAQAVPGPPTFVFDEIDAGIGGRAALAVGARLAQLARHSQVIVVTHLAQVAAHADRHLVVRKSDDGHVIRTEVHRVEGAARLEELARMLGGTDSAAALEHARDLVDRVGGQVVRAWENGQDVPTPATTEKP